ncbi:MAG: DUF1385 domain-containing protein [Clostridia bacterium]|nr:DUF1385 domain-containing protein [Clostridia bacterium]
MKEKNELIACRRKTSIGGQALMEGIMMRGPEMTAMAVRNTKGEIVVEEFETKSAKRPAICRWPIIRGVFGYIDSMVLGYKCMMRSAEISGLEDIVEEKPKKAKKGDAAEAVTSAEADATPEEKTATVAATAQSDGDAEGTAAEAAKDEEKLPAWVMTLTMVFSLVLGIGLAIALFLFLPTFLFNLAADHIGFLQGENVLLNSFIKSAFEGILRVLLLVGYMAAISLMKEIRRTFMFHGAEHKCIFCYEAGLELTVENVRKMRRFHPRCGTSFLILMVLVSIFVSFFIDPISVAVSGNVLPTVLRMLVKLLLIPVIVGLGYELIKFAGRHDNWFTRVISAPGVWLQHITVFEPTDGMIECAITALKRVIPENGSDKW